MSIKDITKKFEIWKNSFKVDSKKVVKGLKESKEKKKDDMYEDEDWFKDVGSRAGFIK